MLGAENTMTAKIAMVLALGRLMGQPDWGVGTTTQCDMCDNGVGQGAAHAHAPLAHTGVTASFLWGRVLERKSPEVVGVCQMK